MSVNPEIFMEWPARDFWHMIRYHAWREDAKREYGKLLTEKK